MIIFRYICKELYTHLLAIVLVMLIIFMTNQFVNLLDKAASGEVTILAVMKIMSLQIPLLLGYLLPLSFYLSILLVFGRLYMDHEMAVLSACGVSKRKLLTIVMCFGFGVMIVVAWLMIWVEPVMEKYQFKIYGESIASATIAKIAPKRFQPLGKYGVFYAQSLSKKQGQMQDVFLAMSEPQKDSTQPVVWDITVAKQAQEKNIANQTDRYLVFNDGSRYVGPPGYNNYQVMNFAQYGIRLLNALPHIGGGMLVVPTSELWPERHKDPKADAIIQWRFALPISVLIFPLITFPLSEVNPRRGRFMQLFPAILIYVGYADLLFLGRAWITNGTLSPTIGLWWMHGALLLIGVFLLFYKTEYLQNLFRKKMHVHS